MKKILTRIGMIGCGIIGTIGLYKLALRGFTWLFMLVFGGIASLLPYKDVTED